MNLDQCKGLSEEETKKEIMKKIGTGICLRTNKTTQIWKRIQKMQISKYI